MPHRTGKAPTGLYGKKRLEISLSGPISYIHHHKNKKSIKKIGLTFRYLYYNMNILLIQSINIKEI
jgi:hypothetical protein